MAHLRTQADLLGNGDRVGETPDLAMDGRMAGRVGESQVTPHTGHVDQVFGGQRRRRVAQGRPVRLGGTAPAETGVDLEVDTGGPTGKPGGRGDLCQRPGSRR